ncbi:hypothetical protein GXB85_12985 [Cellulomonas sp. APG4]|uniref:DUF6308 family protein n=1 Tax=Cellulomonas sp. APG4 TaxID=1538656 RepID=UPI00137960BE|nr:hypothetical protein [Cellulomonas sp. APG4]
MTAYVECGSVPQALATQHDAAWTSEITPVDLLITVQVAGPLPTRSIGRLLHHRAYRWEIERPLRELPAVGLALAGPLELEAMERALVGARMGFGDVRAAHALCALKRPDLFPLLDDAVVHHLGLPGTRDHRSYWLACRHLIGQRRVIQRLDEVADRVLSEDGQRVTPDQSRLRLLDLVVRAAIGSLAGPFT